MRGGAALLGERAVVDARLQVPGRYVVNRDRVSVHREATLDLKRVLAAGPGGPARPALVDGDVPQMVLERDVRITAPVNVAGEADVRSARTSCDLGASRLR